MSSWRVILIGIVGISGGWPTYGKEIVLHVSLNGPVRTLAAAIQKARLQRQPGDIVRIMIAPGLYYLSQPIVLEPQDSFLIIEGERGQAPVLSGGRRVLGWKRWKGKILQADLSSLNLPDVHFRELYYNTKQQIWARTPNFDPAHPRTGGFLQNDGLAEAGTKTKFRYPAGALHPERWAHPTRAWIMFHDKLNYETQFCPVKSIDPQQRIIEAERGVYELAPGCPFFLCGILEELDAPGEWAVDPETKTLYFWPPYGNPEASDCVVVPALASGFVLQGKPEDGQFVENVRISGLDLRDFRGPAIRLTGAQKCAITRCDLRNCDAGVFFGLDTHGCLVQGCDITATQGDGISLWGSPQAHERITDHVIDNNYIYDIGWGRIHNRCGGVYGHGMQRIKITHNHIHDTPRYAIGMDVGGSCEIAYNYCHHANLVTLDSGIIEAATAYDWRLPKAEQMERNRRYNWGNVIHHNLIHDSGGWGINGEGKLQSPQFTWGIYLDTHSSGWHIHDNICYNTVLGAYIVNGGMENVFENNICVDGQRHQAYLSLWPNYECRGNRLERNIFVSPGKSASIYIVRKADKEAYLFRQNLLWANGEEIRINAPGLPQKQSWEAWRALGQEEGSLIADPQFVAPQRRYYALRPDSPAFRVGFRPIDLSGVGLYKSPERRTWPRPEIRVVRDVMDYHPVPEAKPSQPLLRTYEDYALNETERQAHVGEEGELATVRVTEETAASGRHSLRVAEKPGVQRSFVPYITYPLEMESGILRAGFDLRWEPGALFVYEWRDDPYHYNLGPRLETDAQGNVSANGQALLRLPAGQWMRFDLTCGLGPQNTGRYELIIKPSAGGPEQKFHITHSEKFTTLNCVVIMSLTQGESVFYLDNVTFQPQGKGNTQKGKM